MTLPDVTSYPEALEREIQRIRQSGVLREGRLRALFDYLAERSTGSGSPKEVEIAIDVFGKGAEFDVSQDALVRVYVHKLRRALESYYQTHGGEGVVPIQIPRGSYRFVLELPAPSAPNVMADEEATLTVMPAAVRPRSRFYVYGLVAAAAVLGFVFGAVYFRGVPADLDAVRHSPAWRDLLADDRPILIVVGDYYLFGEMDSPDRVRRLLRDFSVNSKADLERFRAAQGATAAQYKDVGTRLLPTSTADVLWNIVPIFTDQVQAGRRMAISLASDVTADTIKYVDIVYIGPLSGLASLEPVVFAGSRFLVGSSYDELLDRKTGHRYVSQSENRTLSPTKNSEDPAYHDYGFFTHFRGPGGNLIVALMGTRNEGVRQTAELFTNARKLAALSAQWRLQAPFEALVEVDAINGVNLNGRVLLATDRKTH
jgi:hypothetical protein